VALLGVLLVLSATGCKAGKQVSGSSPSASATATVASSATSAPTTAPTFVALAHSPSAAPAWRLAYSSASSTTVQQQPPAGSCLARGTGLWALQDVRCTPGALNPAVTQATIHRTICVSGYTKTIRPSYAVTRPEKTASMQAYGDPATASAYEYDHLVSLELGGAANDERNLWPEPGGSPNPKDSLENRLHRLVCDGSLTLAAAQRAIAVDWVRAYRQYVGSTGTISSTVTATTQPTRATSSSCRASVSDATPPRGGNETVTVTTTAGASVRTFVHYKTTTSEHDGVADGSGVTRITFSIGRPTAGYTVQVSVSTGSGQSCSTAFTPQ